MSERTRGMGGCTCGQTAGAWILDITNRDGYMGEYIDDWWMGGCLQE